MMKNYSKWLMITLSLVAVIVLTACTTNLRDDSEGSLETPIENENSQKDVEPDQNDSEDESQNAKGVDVLENLDTHIDAQYLDGTLTTDFEVINSSDDPITVTFTSGQRFDYQIQDEAGEILYSWSSNKSFIQMMMDETLEPGGSWVFNEMVSAPELVLEPGEYKVIYTMNFYYGEEMSGLASESTFIVE